MKAVKTQERLFEEFIDFQKMPKTEIPQFVWIEPSDDQYINYCHMDRIWLCCTHREQFTENFVVLPGNSFGFFYSILWWFKFIAIFIVKRLLRVVSFNFRAFLTGVLFMKYHKLYGLSLQMINTLTIAIWTESGLI
jgi:hypothetical protein